MDPVTAMLILATVSIALMLLAPKPKSAKPASLGDSLPKVDEDRKIPVIFGQVWVANSAIVWYGDVFTIPIKSSGGK